MTFAEMRTEAETLFESIISDAAPGFTNAEWGTMFTAAQRIVVRNILKDGIAKDILNSLMLTALIVYDAISDFTTDDFYLNSDGTPAQTIDTSTDNFESDVYWVLDEYAVTATCSRIPLLRKTYDFYQKNIDNPFTQPDTVDGFWILSLQDTDDVSQSRPVFITDGSEITNYKYIGIEHPDTYAIASGSDCVLHESLHGDIVSMAVNLAHKSIIDPEGFQMAIATEQLKK